MKQETYRNMMETMREKPRRVRLIQRVNQLLTGIVFFSYPLFLGTLLIEKSDFLLRAVIVPAVSFAAVTVFRRMFNAPRPYEKFGVPPVLEKDTSGKSFPSRHVVSVFLIAATVFVHRPDAGILLGILGIILGIIRVVGGVHEPRDVIAGMAAGILCAYVGYYLIP